MGVIRGIELERRARTKVAASTDAEWLSAEVEDGRLRLFVEEGDDTGVEEFEVAMFATGDEVPDYLQFVDTVQFNGNTVHVYVDDQE